LKDPLLSVTFAPKEKLPPKIYIIGCELDLLCKESEAMAERLASEGTKESIKSSGVWERNGVKWEQIMGEEHGISLFVSNKNKLAYSNTGFDAVPTFGKNKIRVEKRRKEMFESVAEWLFREVYR
jgi:acetyl esterase/lipase